jgi:hypothetical protein
MANQDLVKFISEQFAAGHPEENIRAALKSQGWQDSDIDMAFSAWKTNPSLPERKSLGKFVGESWEVLKAIVGKVKDLYLSFAVFLGIFIVAIIIISVYASRTSNEMNYIPVIMGLILVPFAIYFASWFQVALIHLIRDRNNPAMTAAMARESAKPLIWRYFFTTLLVGFYTFLWFLLFIIPGIIYGVRYTLAKYIVVDRNVSGGQALELSKKYVSGMWWQVAMSLLVLGGVTWLASLAVEVVGGIATAGFGEVAGVIISNVLFLGLYLVITPYTNIYMMLLYENLKKLKPEVQ